VQLKGKLVLLRSFGEKYMLLQGSYSETNFEDFFRTQSLQYFKIQINPFNGKITMLVLLTVCHTFHIFLLEFNRFPDLSRTSRPFKGLLGFPGPI